MWQKPKGRTAAHTTDTETREGTDMANQEGQPERMMEKDEQGPSTFQRETK